MEDTNSVQPAQTDEKLSAAPLNEQNQVDAVSRDEQEAQAANQSAIDFLKAQLIDLKNQQDAVVKTATINGLTEEQLRAALSEVQAGAKSSETKPSEAAQSNAKV